MTYLQSTTLPSSAYLQSNQDTGREGGKILELWSFTVPPPTPGNPKVLCASWSRLTLVQYQAGAGDMHKVWGPETYLEPGGGDMPPPQLMSEPFPRDKVEMTRKDKC